MTTDHEQNPQGETQAAPARPTNPSVDGPAVPEGDPQAMAKLLVEVGPVAIFFVTQWFSGRLFGIADDQRIFWATGVFMVATIASLIASRILFQRIPIMPLVSGVLILFFGALTLFLQDDYFIKIKPTIVNVIFGTALFSSLYLQDWIGLKKPLLQYIFGSAFNLTDTGWRILTFRWAAFFLFLAVLNEVVWRTTSTDFWTAFKFFGVFPITLIFALSQIGVLTKCQAK